MKSTPPFIIAIIASVTAHAAVMVSSYSSDITLPSSTGSVMSVKLEEKILKKKPKTQQNNITKKTENSANTPGNITHTQTEEIKTEPGLEKRHAESRAQVISIIYKKLKQRFTYPKVAVRRNWQGKVLLSLRVSPSGHIKKIQLAKSSGYSILDQAAINALSNIGNLPQTSTWLNGDIELKLPIIYKLSEG